MGADGDRFEVDRDQATSAFTGALGRLCDAIPAVSAALVDAEGETVDYAGRLTPFEIRIAAAECRIVLQQASRCALFVSGATQSLFIRTRSVSFCALSLSDGYAVVLQLAPGAFSLSERAYAAPIRELCLEAGLAVPKACHGARWSKVDVREWPQTGHRPRAILYDGNWHEVEVLGRYDGPDLARRELGFRVRLGNGLETTLVRERLGRWFSDHLGFGGSGR